MSTDDSRATVVDPDLDPSVDDGYDDPSDPESPDDLEPTKRKRSGLAEWIIVVVVAISSALLVRAYVLQQFAVEGTSMLNTLHPSDRVLVNKLSYRLHDPRRGDVVVLKRIESNSQERDLIKRVVGLPGETLEYHDCQLFINGSLVNEPYLDPLIVSPNRCGADQPAVLVQPKHVFVMGDNRGGSLDSRDASVGQIDYSNLIGRAFVVMWPFADWQWLSRGTGSYMAGDDWWTQAVDQFGLETAVEPKVSAPVSDPEAEQDEPAAPPDPAAGRRRRRRAYVEWLVIAAAALGAAFLLRFFVVQQFAVDGESMLGTLHSGDRVIVNKLSYHLHDPRHGDIVVLKDTKESLEVRDLIKRVIALPGETIEYRDCQLFIDGRRVPEPYLDPVLVSRGHCGDAQLPVEVEPGHVFVMGDNRNASLDSRTAAIGQISYGNLIGRAFVVVWPTADWRWL